MLEQMTLSGVSRWKALEGDLRLWCPAPHVLLTRFEGRYYSLEFAERVMGAIEQIAALQPSPDIFHDWEGMQDYAPESRMQMTQQARRLMPRINSFTLLTRSKLAQWGIRMANLALGGRLTAVTERVDFEQALGRAITRLPLARA